jgi:hypothetical protein
MIAPHSPPLVLMTVTRNYVSLLANKLSEQDTRGNPANMSRSWCLFEQS